MLSLSTCWKRKLWKNKRMEFCGISVDLSKVNKMLLFSLRHFKPDYISLKKMHRGNTILENVLKLPCFLELGTHRWTAYVTVNLISEPVSSTASEAICFLQLSALKITLRWLNPWNIFPTVLIRKALSTLISLSVSTQARIFDKLTRFDL